MDQETPDDFTVTSDVIDDRVTVAVTGEVDMSTAEAMFRATTPDRVNGAVLDLTGVTFFDSAAIHALVRLYERFPQNLQVIPSPQVLRVLDISGLSGQPWLKRVAD